MDPLTLALELGVVPALLAGLGARLGPRFAALGAGLAVLAAYVALHGAPRWPPGDATAWLVPAVIVGLVWVRLPAHRLAWLGRWGYGALLLGLALRLWVERTGLTGFAVLNAMGLGLSLLWTGLARTHRPALTGAGCVAAMAGAAMALGGTGSARLAMLSGVLAVAVGAGMAAARPGERQEVLRAVLPVVVPGYAILLATGTVYGELPAWAALALAAAPLATGWGLWSRTIRTQRVVETRASPAAARGDGR